MAGVNSRNMMSNLMSAAFYKGLLIGFLLGAAFIYLIVNRIIQISLPGLTK
ncbi:MAG: hypothetical protein NTZ02_00160 [Candidatus Woesearchaeota archaeon]|nr:hypothetical protein [Candidatus Woesearchaeota archaeon]